MVKFISKIPAIERVPETVLRQKNRNKEAEKRRLEKSANLKKHRESRKKEWVQRAEKYSKEYKQIQDEALALQSQANKEGSFYVKPEAKLGFAIRIRGLKEMAPKVAKALQLLRLRQQNNGVFVRLNKATINMLRVCEPYITWGYPDLEHVKKLIYKRGFAKINGQRLPLDSNFKIENALGKKDIICMEDLIHEIFTVGPNFKEANSFLWPFKLRSPKGSLNSIKAHFIEGGDFGNREDLINNFIDRAL